jgi:hypothetical protein
MYCNRLVDVGMLTASGASAQSGVGSAKDNTITVFDLPVPDGAKASDVFERIMVGVNQRGGQTVTWPSPTTLVVTRRSAGCLIVLACIIFFPIGLLALLARKTETLTVRIEEREGRLWLSALGEGDPQIVAALKAFLADMVGTAESSQPGEPS